MAFIFVSLILGNFLWEAWGISTLTVFIRAVWLTFIVGIFAYFFAKFLSPDLFYQTIETLNKQGEFHEKFDVFKWLFAGIMTSFWVSYSFLKAEFISKFTILRQEHDNFSNRPNHIFHHIDYDLNDNSFEVDVPLWNWCEDVLLFELYRHESFKNTFDTYVGLYKLYLERYEDDPEHLFNEYDCYPRMHKHFKKIPHFKLIKIRQNAFKILNHVKTKKSGNKEKGTIKQAA